MSILIVYTNNCIYKNSYNFSITNVNYVLTSITSVTNKQGLLYVLKKLLVSTTSSGFN